MKDKDENTHELFKDIIKGNENRIRNFFIDKIRTHFKARVPGIADDFMQELENIPVSKKDTLELSYEMKFYVKDILQFIKPDERK